MGSQYNKEGDPLAFGQQPTKSLASGLETRRPMGFQPIPQVIELPSGKPPLVSIEILMERPTADPQALSLLRKEQYDRLRGFRPVDMSRLGVVLEKPLYLNEAGDIFVPADASFASRDAIKKFQKGIRTGLAVLYAQSTIYTKEHETKLVD